MQMNCFRVGEKWSCCSGNWTGKMHCCQTKKKRNWYCCSGNWTGKKSWKKRNCLRRNWSCWKTIGNWNAKKIWNRSKS